MKIIVKYKIKYLCDNTYKYKIVKIQNNDIEDKHMYFEEIARELAINYYKTIEGTKGLRSLDNIIDEEGENFNTTEEIEQLYLEERDGLISYNYLNYDKKLIKKLRKEGNNIKEIKEIFI